MSPPSLSVHVNGVTHEIDVEPGTPLLDVLRDRLGLRAAKRGCGLEQCMACAVIIDGRAVPSCVLGVDAVVGKEITTLEGLGGPGRLHPLQRAFADEQAAQCGYCIPGMIMGAKALLDREPRPSDAQVRAALAPHLCRCGTHPRVLRAVRRVAGA